MNRLIVSVGLSLLTTIAALSGTQAIARDTDSSRKATVYYSELNSSSESGASALYVRLRAAARQVCAPLDGRELRQRSEFRACYEQALTNAVLQVNRSAVTAVHMRATKSTKAS